jgi:hypothetical protein
VLVNVRDVHNDSEAIWESIEGAIKSDSLKTVRQVWDELERRFGPIHKRLKRYRKTLLIADSDLYAPDVVAEIREIRRHHQTLINPFGGGNPADPFLIAVAKSLSAVVVTDEKAKGSGHRSRIPYVCTNRNVGWMTGSDYLKELGCDI